MAKIHSCCNFSASLDSLKFVHLLTEKPTQKELIESFDVNLVYLCQQAEDNSQALPCVGIGKCFRLLKMYK